jgi:membrane-associated phospholipid phosphatase
VLGVLVAQTGAARLDGELFRAIHSVGPGPELVWTILDPHTRNYIALVAIALAAAVVSSGFARIAGVGARVLGSALLAFVLLEAVYAVYDRPRPEEALGVTLHEGHSWAHLNSFPSGHMAITAALAVSTALLFRRLRYPLFAYVALVAFTRVMFGAHFPGDVLAGTALGVGSALVVALAVERRQELRSLLGSLRTAPAGARLRG